MKQIIVCPGSINPDFTISTERELKLHNGTITFQGKSRIGLGGKGSNQAVGARRAASNAKVILVGCVGNDDLGKKAIEELRKHEIATQHIKTTDEAETGKCILSLFAKGVQVVGLDLGANLELTPEDVTGVEGIIAESNILLCQLENPVSTTRRALELARKHEVFTILNPSIVPKDKKVVRDMLPLVDLLTLNIQETYELTGAGSNKESEAAKILRASGVPNVIITLGEKGSFVSTKDKETFISAHPTKVKDTTACGDIFTGALAATLLNKDLSRLEHRNLLESVKFASVAASISLTRTGATESAPSREEILSELANYSS